LKTDVAILSLYKRTGSQLTSFHPRQAS